MFTWMTQNYRMHLTLRCCLEVYKKFNFRYFFQEKKKWKKIKRKQTERENSVRMEKGRVDDILHKTCYFHTHIYCTYIYIEAEASCIHKVEYKGLRDSVNFKKKGKIVSGFFLYSESVDNQRCMTHLCVSLSPFLIELPFRSRYEANTFSFLASV